MHNGDAIEIEDGVTMKCPNCKSIFAIEGEHEILYRNISFIHINSETGKGIVKCRRCKYDVSITLSGGRVLIIE